MPYAWAPVSGSSPLMMRLGSSSATTQPLSNHPRDIRAK
jgi:hypothetical protein